MVNIGFGWTSVLGIALVVAGAALYFLRSVRPGLARDHDIFFAAIALLSGGILFFNGWRQDPILQFGQTLVTGAAIFFAVESIRLRAVATEQAKRNTPIVDEDRPVSRVYRAEFDELAPVEERPVRRRIQGTRDTRDSRDSRASRDDYYDEGTRRRPSSSRPTDDRLGSGGDRARKRRPRPVERPPVETYDEWDAPTTDYDEDEQPRRTPPPRSSGGPSATSRPRRPRPPQETEPPQRDKNVRDEEEPAPSDYVEYKPVDPADDETDNWGEY